MSGGELATERTVGGVVLRCGQHLEVAERDYRYGAGPIHLVVRAVGTVLNDDDDEQWLELHTDQVMWDRSTSHRLVQVRVSALRAALRPTPSTGS